MPGRRRKLKKLTLIYGSAVLPAVLLDQFTKICMQHLLGAGGSLPVLKGVFHLTLVHNTGAAFGMLSGHTQLFTIISLVSLVLINIFIWAEWEKLTRTELAGLVCVLAGVTGNLIDRMTRGHVIDFLDFRVWPVFNLADSYITTGAVLLGISLFLRSWKAQPRT